ncbi:hypothetical protein VTO73DRAFT_10560 [Trametes versicolor]
MPPRGSDSAFGRWKELGRCKCRWGPIRQLASLITSNGKPAKIRQSV